MAEQWYKNQEQKQLSIKCDEAFYNNDVTKLEKLAEECFSRGKKFESKNENIMVSAKYFYNAGTCKSDILNITKRNAEDEDYEWILLCYRKAFKLADVYSRISTKKVGWERSTEKKQFYGFYYSLITNMSILLNELGRKISAVSIIYSTKNFSLGNAQQNLGLFLFEYGKLFIDSDNIAANILFKYAYLFLEAALKNDDGSMPNGIEEGTKKVLRYVDEFKDLKIQDNENIQMNDEVSYRLWACNNRLFLTPVNDVINSLVFAKDDIRIQSLVIPVEEDGTIELIGLFNEIKQEYVSARFTFYESISKKDMHFSDKDVDIWNVADYSIYNLRIQQMKMAFRSIYSIFDRIGFFIFKYLDIKMNERRVSFNSIWDKVSKDELKNNDALNGLKWIHKDLNKKVDLKLDTNKESLDPELKDEATIRNYIEHRYLKVVDFSNGGSNIEHSSNGISYSVSKENFEKLTLYLMKKVREAIILLTIMVKFEEENKGNDDNLPIIEGIKIDDEFK